LLESARGPLPSLAELIAGEPIRGSWWAHPKSHEIFVALNRVAESRAVVRTRLLGGKVTLIHRRLWPALARVAERFPAGALDAVHQEHTASGAHRKTLIPFPEWLPSEVQVVASTMLEEVALQQLPQAVRPPTASP
jgi:hypothetical protein